MSSKKYTKLEKKLKELQIDIGIRLKEVRTAYYANHKLSISDFAEELNETRHNIGNYERGIANVPNRLLAALYEKGINPIYIITGEGSVFAPNEAGRQLSKTSNIKSLAETIEKFEESDELENVINAAAGDIAQLLIKKKNERAK